MKLKITLQRSGRQPVDLIATIDARTTVADLADYISQSDPDGIAFSGLDEGRTLSLVGPSGPLAIDPDLTVADSGLRSGATITVSHAGSAFLDPYRNAAAVVLIVSGPNANTEIPIARGTSLVGREPECEVTLKDPMVSRRHARINVTDFVEIIDLSSSNGVQLGGIDVDRAVLQPADVVRLGDTQISVRTIHTAQAKGETDVAQEFVRSPRLDPSYEGREFEAPQPPERPSFQRFPLIPLLAPMVLAGIMYLITKNVASILFVALSPLLLVGSVFETRMSGKSAFKKAVAEWRDDVADLISELETVAAAESEHRRREHPSTAECVDATHRTTPLLWTRRPGEPRFGELRLGLARLPSRNVVDLKAQASRSVPRALQKELADALERFSEVDNVAVIGDLFANAIGVAGPRPLTKSVVGAYIVQAVSLHSPSELMVTGFASSRTAADWAWMKWLPHTTSPHSPIQQNHLAATAAEGISLIAELEELLSARSGGEDKQLSMPGVLVLVEDDAPVDRSRLVHLAEHGPAHGISVLWHAPDTGRLPAACRTFVELVRDATSGRAGFVHHGSEVAPLAAEITTAEAAHELARRLSPLVDSGARTDDASDLPRAVSQLTVMGREVGSSAAAVIERWVQSHSIVSGRHAVTRRPQKTLGLRSVVGSAAAGRHVLDLRVHGPHALVGGTTGAGKSELLQTWILGLASAHSPQRVNFLLVDYKGGTAFSDCVKLPHTVGMVTDLSPHEVRRALTSLKAEIHHREVLLNEYRAKDLATLELEAPEFAPPSLVIVVDEFAALAKEVPEFVEGVVDVAQRGRSLGLHLILATQRPAGVITDNIRANTNLRVALRMADENDSTDVLGSPIAAGFDPTVAGRAVSKTGPGRLVPFQTAYAGGWTLDETPPEILLEELTFGIGREWRAPVDENRPAPDPQQTDIKRMVHTIRQASAEAELPAPRVPWKPVLGTVYDLSKRAQVPTHRRDNELVFGIGDVPARQEQPAVAFYPDRHGNLAVFGTGGSGKSTLLRTIAVAASHSIHGGPCHVYGLDFGSRGLALLDALPNVGTVVYGDDHERVVRLLTWLRDLIAERARRYSAAHAGTIAEYRERGNAPEEPRILLLVDGLPAFRSAYESSDRSQFFDLFASIATDGRGVGVHIVASSDQRGAVSTNLSSAFQARVALRMVNQEDYAFLNAPVDILHPNSPPGRGVFDGIEIQVAVLAGRTDILGQAAALRAFAEMMEQRTTWPAAPKIDALAEHVDLIELPVTVDDLPAIGMASSTLAPFGIDPHGTFVVSGPPASGRTTTLLTLVRALRSAKPDGRLYYIGSRRSPLAGEPGWLSIATSADEATVLAQRVSADLANATESAQSVVVIENASEYQGSSAENALQDMVRALIAHDQFLIVEGEATTLQRDYGSFLQLAKSSRTGLALSPDQGDGTPIFRTNFPRIDRSAFPPGRALYVTQGRTEVVQIAYTSGSHNESRVSR